MQIQDVKVRVLFNGRGDPGIEADVIVQGGMGRALSPSGASRGAHEALPFANDDPAETVRRFESFRGRLLGTDASDMAGLSRLLREVDGTPNYARIGGSLAYAVSVAAAEAEASARGVQFCRVIDPERSALPFPLGNVVGGGKHASDLSPSIQEMLVCPLGARSPTEAVELNLAVHKRAGKVLSKMLQYPLGKGDEGGWSPGLTDEQAMQVVSEAAQQVQDETGRRIRVGADMAADSLYDGKGSYYYRSTKRTLSREGQMAFVSELKDRFDLFYIEDPLYEEDFEGYAQLRESLGGALVTGDDLYVTNPGRLKTGIAKRSTNGVIVKVNQVGTLGEAQEFSRLARESGHVLAASHRSGDNEGGHLAHFAVGFGCGLIKCGIVGGERTAKMNEVVRVGEALGATMAQVKV